MQIFQKIMDQGFKILQMLSGCKYFITGQLRIPMQTSIYSHAKNPIASCQKQVVWIKLSRKDFILDCIVDQYGTENFCSQYIVKNNKQHQELFCWVQMFVCISWILLSMKNYCILSIAIESRYVGCKKINPQNHLSQLFKPQKFKP